MMSKHTDKIKKVSYSDKIKNFKPTKATASVFKEVYPNLGKDVYMAMIEQFKDAALNRKQPFKNLDAGMRNYLRRKYIQPVMAEYRKNNVVSFRDIGDIVRSVESNKKRLPEQILIENKG